MNLAEILKRSAILYSERPAVAFVAKKGGAEISGADLDALRLENLARFKGPKKCILSGFTTKQIWSDS